MSEELEKLSEDVVDLVNAIEAACVNFKHRVGQRYGVGVKPASWDPAKIKWVDAEGTKGPYQRYPAEGDKAEVTSDYKNMLAAIKQHSMIRNGYFYWVFQDGATVGRKLRKGKQVAPQAAKADVENIKSNFPSDLAELLSFEVEGQFFVLKPIRFLGSENFAKIAAVVRSLSGEYVSAGKDSRFKIPK